MSTSGTNSRRRRVKVRDEPAPDEPDFTASSQACLIMEKWYRVTADVTRFSLEFGPNLTSSEPNPIIRQTLATPVDGKEDRKRA